MQSQHHALPSIFSRTFTQWLIGCLSLMVASHLLAQTSIDAPEAQAINQVHTYYNYGENAIVTAAKICRGINKTSPDKFECMGEIASDTVLQAGGEYYYWISLLIPQKWDKSIHFQMYFGNTLVREGTYSASPSLRYRLWKNMPTNKTGTWTIVIEQVANTSNNQVDPLSLVRTQYLVK